MRSQRATHSQRAQSYALDGESGVTLTLSQDGTQGLKLDLISVERKGEGSGTRVLSNLLRYADINGLFITLSPSSVFGSDPKRLLGWYEKHGFTKMNSKSLVRNPRKLT